MSQAILHMLPSYFPLPQISTPKTFREHFTHAQSQISVNIWFSYIVSNSAPAVIDVFESHVLPPIVNYTKSTRFEVRGENLQQGHLKRSPQCTVLSVLDLNFRRII